MQVVLQGWFESFEGFPYVELLQKTMGIGDIVPLGDTVEIRDIVLRMHYKKAFVESAYNIGKCCFVERETYMLVRQFL